MSSSANRSLCRLGRTHDGPFWIVYGIVPSPATSCHTTPTFWFSGLDPCRIHLVCPFQGRCFCYLFRLFWILPFHDDNRSLKLLSFFPMSHFYVVVSLPKVGRRP